MGVRRVTGYVASKDFFQSLIVVGYFARARWQGRTRTEFMCSLHAFPGDHYPERASSTLLCETVFSQVGHF